MSRAFQHLITELKLDFCYLHIRLFYCLWKFSVCLLVLLWFMLAFSYIDNLAYMHHDINIVMWVDLWVLEVIKHTLNHFYMYEYLYLWTHSTMRLKVLGPLSSCPWHEVWHCGVTNLNLSALLQWMCECMFSLSPCVTQCGSTGLSNSLSGIQLMVCVNLRKREILGKPFWV